MPVTAPKCKLCGETHWSPVCPNIGGKKFKPDIKAIEAKAASAGSKKPQKAKLKRAEKRSALPA